MTPSDKLTQIAENIPKVFEAGKKDEYDAFWDAFQDGGKRTGYSYAFTTRFWNKNTFNPKYPIAPTQATYMFQNFNNNLEWATRKNRMDMSNFEFDFSDLTDASYLFHNARVENIFCDLSNATKIFYAFGSPQNGSIDKLTIRISEKCTNFDYAFHYQTYTETLLFTDDSIIAASISFQWSESLSRASIESIINALSDSVTGKTLTLSKHAIPKAFGSADSEAWQQLIASKPNWTISLM